MATSNDKTGLSLTFTFIFGVFMKLITATFLALSLAVTGVANADDDYDYNGYDRDDLIEQQIYTDAQYAQKRQQAINILKKKGYQVVSVEADEHRGQKTLDIEAYKNGYEYDIKMSYPSLQIIRERRDD